MDLLQCVHKTLSRHHFNATHGQTLRWLVLRAPLQAALQYDQGTLLNCISFTKWWNAKLCSRHAGWHRSLSKYVILALQLDSNDMKGANAMQLEPLIILVTNRKSLKGSRRKSLILHSELPELCLAKGTDKWQVWEETWVSNLPCLGEVLLTVSLSDIVSREGKWHWAHCWLVLVGT